jgi:hypothetical protein
VSTVSTILGLLLIAACAGSALMDFRKPATLVASMQKLKVPEKKLPLLGAIKDTLPAFALLVMSMLYVLTSVAK